MTLDLEDPNNGTLNFVRMHSKSPTGDVEEEYGLNTEGEWK